MSAKEPQNLRVALLGAGCASLSLAARADDLGSHDLTIIDPETHPSDEHIWGFWSMPWIPNTDDVVTKRWSRWRIVTATHSVTHSTKLYPYCALKRHDWIARCRDHAVQHGVKFMRTAEPKDAAQILDSRPPSVPDGMMLQHFSGYEVETKKAVFDDTTAILMDFRCDQSLGMHFIYCLPLSNRRALIESTIFSPKVAGKDYYDAAITTYMSDIVGVDDFVILRREAGVIPLGVLGVRDPAFTGFGGNGGAIRPSSGYAFSFIQKQISQMVCSARTGRPLVVKTPHSRFEIWMDHILLAVIRKQPDLAPTIFTRMAAKLSGDEFALFLSGEATAIIWAKVVLAMPKMVFIKALFHQEQRATRL